MKKLMLLAIAGVALAYPETKLQAGDDDGPPGQNKGRVAPGLQKKGGLPPGQAKKRGGQNNTQESAATNATDAASPNAPTTPATPSPSTVIPQSTPSAPGATAPGTSTPGAANPATAGDVASPGSASTSTRRLDKEALERRARLNKKIEELDAMGRRPEVRDRMLSRMYRISQIPISSLEAQEKAHPEVGVGGIMIANTLARHAKVPVDQIYAEHKAGKSWGEMANDHRVNTADLIEKVADYEASGRDAEHDARRQVGSIAAPSAPTIIQAREPERPSVAVVTPTPPALPQPPQAPAVTLPKAPTFDVAVATPKAPTPPATSGRVLDKEALERRARLNQHIEELDAMGRRPEVRDRMLSRMYRISQIPISSLEAQEKAHPETGVGGIMIANTLARHAKVPVEQIYAEHKAGKSWGEMANDHRVNTADLLEKVADYKASARDAEHDAAVKRK